MIIRRRTPRVGLTQGEFGRVAGVAQQVISRAVRAGKLIAAPDGSLDPRQPVNAAYIALHAPGAAAAAGHAAQIADMLAKARLKLFEIERDELGHLERAALADQWAADARHLQARVAAIPGRCAGQLADELDRPVAVAHAILEQFIGQLLVELSGYEAEVRATILQLH
jgi:hypothetical protein